MSALLTIESIAPPGWTRPPLDALSRRERDVLAALAEGRSNGAIAHQLFVSERTVEAHLHAIMQKLDLMPSADTNRRVLAATAWLRGGQAVPGY